MGKEPIRLATAADLDAINEIYNYYVLHKNCTYQIEPETTAARAAWFAAHGPEHPVCVAVLQGEVVGWGALSPFHPRAAYAHSVEDSIYVRQGWQRRGIGRALLDDLIVRGKSIGHHTILALVDSSQEASIALHEKAGFTRAGWLREVGYKNEQWLDVLYLQRML